MSYSLNWKSLSTISEFEKVIDDSVNKPIMIFKYRPSSAESIGVKEALESQWSIPTDIMDTFLVDVMKDKELSSEISEFAGITNEYPQVVLFADGVTMYDESHEMISVKKIKLALKIINRTFKWMETRV